MADKSRRRVRATDAAKNFGRLIDHVRETQVPYTVERSGVPVARVVPMQNHWTVREFAEWVAGRRADRAFTRAVESGRAALNKPALPDDPWGS